MTSDRDTTKGGRGHSPYPPGEPLTTMRVPKRIVAQVKAFAEKLAWETLEDD